MSEFNLSVVSREADKQGKGASRRLRKENLVPAIIYGGKEEPVAIAIKANELAKAIQSDAFFSSILSLNVNGKDEEVIIKAMQRHPSKGYPLHVDFQRIVRGQTMNFTVPLHFVGKDDAPAKEHGGILQTNMTEVEITCLPRQLPEFIEVDVSKFNIGDAIRLSELNLPKGLSVTQLDNDGTDRVVVIMQPPVVEEVDEPAETEETDANSEDSAEETQDDNQAEQKDEE